MFLFYFGFICMQQMDFSEKKKGFCKPIKYTEASPLTFLENELAACQETEQTVEFHHQVRTKNMRPLAMAVADLDL